MIHYTASKHAVVGLARGFAAELGKAFDPGQHRASGAAVTPMGSGDMIARISETLESNPALQQTMAAFLPDMVTTPEDGRHRRVARERRRPPRHRRVDCRRPGHHPVLIIMSELKFTLEYPSEIPGALTISCYRTWSARWRRRRETAGFSAVAVSEHPAPSAKWRNNGGHNTLDPIAALGFMAASTSTPRLLTNLIVLPFHNPYQIAKSLTSLDILSGGRLIAGVGAGYLRSSFPQWVSNSRTGQSFSMRRWVHSRRSDRSVDAAER